MADSNHAIATPSKTTRFRGWCFTINNWTESDYFGVSNMMRKVAYGICGKEVGESGTPHLQGYARFKSPQEFSLVRGYIPRAHIEPSGGGDAANNRYCSKDGDFREWGTQDNSPGQGARMDIRAAVEVIRSRTLSQQDFMWEYPEIYMKYSRSVEKMFAATFLPRDSPPQVFWRWGLSGVGKTRYCIEKHPDCFIKDNTSWWDGYRQQEAIVIDDFDRGSWNYRDLLQVLDRYAKTVYVKGGSIQLNSPYIYITCEHPPDYYWSGNDLEQVVRRLTSVEEIIKSL